MINYNILEPWRTLDPWQKKYIATEGDCFVLCGRQSGKSAAASIKFGERAANNKNRTILMIAYTEKQAQLLFFKTLMYLQAIYPNMIVKGQNGPTKHVVNLKNGSKILCYAAGIYGLGLVGHTVNHLVIDEAAPMEREVFIAIMPMLSVTGGTMDIISTPRGKEGFFYDCSLDDDFNKFYISAEDCPRHTKEFLAKQRRIMSELEYAQEYLAMFLDELKRVFSSETIKKLCILKRRKKVLQNRIYDLGCDVGRKKDPFTFEIFDMTDKDNIQQVENISNTDIPIPENTRKIIELNRLYNFKKEYIDSGGMGINVCDILREDDDNKRKVVEINNASRRFRDEFGKEKTKGILKEDLYKNLINLVERRKLLLLDDDDIKLSLASIQMEIINGKERYFGNNTHIVEGIHRGVWGAKSKSLNIFARRF